MGSERDIKLIKAYVLNFPKRQAIVILEIIMIVTACANITYVHISSDRRCEVLLLNKHLVLIGET